MSASYENVLAKLKPGNTHLSSQQTCSNTSSPTCQSKRQIIGTLGSPNHTNPTVIGGQISQEGKSTQAISGGSRAMDSNSFVIRAVTSIKDDGTIDSGRDR